MKPFWKFLVTASLAASLSAVVTHSPTSPVYSATDPDEGQVDAPARAQPISVPEANLERINRKPAVEPRVYVESAESKTGFVYYDYSDQVPHQLQHPPSGK